MSYTAVWKGLTGTGWAKSLTAGDRGYNLTWTMVALYPLVVVPGSLPFFYGPRYYLLMAVSLMALPWLYHQRFRYRAAAFYPLLAFLGLALLATLLAVNPVTAWGGNALRYTGLSTYLFCALWFVMALACGRPEKILRSMTAWAGVVALLALLQHFGINPVPHEPFRAGYHSYGTLGNPNFLGSYCVLLLPAALRFYLLERGRGWLALSALLFGALLVSLTRGAWLAFGLIYLVLALYYWRRHEERRALLQLTVVLVLVFVLFSLTGDGVILSRASTISTEIESAVLLEDQAGSHRVYIWKEALKLYPRSWAFGIGPDNLQIPTRPGYIADKAHNIYLEILVTMGLFALVAYLVFLAFCFRNRRKDWLGTTLAFMVAAYLVQGFFNIDVIVNLPLFWIALGLLQRRDLYLAGGTFTESRPPPAEAGQGRGSLERLVGTASLLLAVLVFLALLFFTVPRRGTMAIDGQGTYRGGLVGTAFHGYGEWEALNGTVYRGDFHYGLYDGTGTLSYPGGAEYSGEFVQGYFHGEGRLLTPSGDVLKGNWQKGTLIE